MSTFESLRDKISSGEIRTISRLTACLDDSCTDFEKQILFQFVYFYRNESRKVIAETVAIPATKKGARRGVDYHIIKALAYSAEYAFSCALNHLDTAFLLTARLPEKDRHTFKAKVINVKATVYSTIGLYQRAERLFRASIRAKKAHGDLDGQVKSWYGMALMRYFQGDHCKVIKNCETARKILERGTQSPYDRERIDLLSGLCWLDAKRYDKAEMYLARVTSESFLGQLAARCLLILRLERDNPGQDTIKEHETQLQNRFQNLPLGSQYFVTMILTRYLVAKADKGLGTRGDVVKTLRKQHERFENGLLSLAGRFQAQARFHEGKRRFYELCITEQLKDDSESPQDRKRHAVYWAERFQARAMHALAVPGTGTAMPAGTGDSGRKGLLRLSQLIESDLLVSQHKGTCFVMFFEGERFLHTFVISADRIYVGQVGIETYRQAVKEFEHRDKVCRKGETPAKDVLQSLLPAKALPGKIRRLVIMPPPGLQKVPWWSCTFPGTSNAIIKKCTVSYSFNLSFYKEMYRPAPKVFRKMLFVHGSGKDLSADITKEICWLKKNVPELLEVAVVSTKEDYCNCVANADIVHFSTHCEFNETAPRKSSIVLDDTDLLMRDVLENHPQLTKSPLVFIAACESGRKKNMGASNYFGFDYAFKSVGASRVISTNRRVLSSKIAAFSIEFYESLFRTTNIDKAFANAVDTFKDEVFVNNIVIM